MIQITNKADCCGCTACYHICPVHCIEMCADDEGFLYPKADEEACIGCGRCEKFCPCLNVTKPEGKTSAFITQNRDENVLAESTSGGAFTVIAESILRQGGIVYGAAFDAHYRIVHRAAERPEELAPMRGSKYAQSSLGDVFPKVRDQLQRGRTVLFSGTPCQVAGLTHYLGGRDDHLLLIDTICRAIPSPRMWEAYVRKLADHTSERIAAIHFRSKTYGYHSGSFTCEYADGTRYSGSNRVDPYMKAFHAGLCSRPSCYECRFKTVNRVSDFTLFDCWQPEALVPGLKDNDRGWTGVLVHSDRGRELLNQLAREGGTFPAGAGEKFTVKPAQGFISGAAPRIGTWEFSEEPAGDPEEAGRRDSLCRPDSRSETPGESCEGIRLYEVDVEEALSFTGGMAEQSAPRHPSRDEFYIVMNRDGLDAAFHQFVPISGKDRLIERSKSVLYQTGLLTKIKRQRQT